MSTRVRHVLGAFAVVGLATLPARAEQEGATYDTRILTAILYVLIIIWAFSQ